MRKTLFTLILMTGMLKTLSQPAWNNIVNYGADRTGKAKCTLIINKLVDSLSQSGGGTIFFPAGTFLTGPIILKSNITLYLDAGSVLKFSDDFDDYLPMVQTRWEDVRVRNFRSQIYAYRCENIAIRGDGHIDGQGKKWWKFLESVNKDPGTESKWQAIFKSENQELLARNAYLRSKNNFLRPPMITTYECKNILIEGISMSDPPFWTIMPAFSENITITGITIGNPGESPNTDGIDPSSCANVHISNCHISVGDDCIVIKSGRDEDGRAANSPTENITITNCTMLRGHGGVVIGSEMSGGVRGVAISNCVFDGTDIGIRIKTMRGRGGEVQDVFVSNIIMKDIVNEGVLITLRYQNTPSEPFSERTPAVNNINLSGINIRGARRPIAIYGLAEQPVRQVSFSDIVSFSKNGILLENAAGVYMHDMKLHVTEGHTLEAKDSKDIRWDMVSVSGPADKPAMLLSNCQAVTVSGCTQYGSLPAYVSGDQKCSDIYLLNNIFPQIKTLSANKSINIIERNNVILNNKPNSLTD